MRTVLLLLFFMFMMSGCSTMQGWFGDNVVTETLGVAPEKPTRYSENPQMDVPANRQYKRMTKSKMEEDSELNSQAGSMWVNEGQSSYLFVQNKSRRDGDILNVKLDGTAQKQVETKVGVIKKLLKQLEEQQEAEKQRLAEQNAGTGDRAPASEKKEEPKKQAAAPEKEEKQDLSDIQNIPTKIVERMPDGNYRVKGQQPFMIGKREYKVIVTGLIRPEDFNDEGVSSGKLLDPQYDVVSLRRKQGNEQSTSL